MSRRRGSGTWLILALAGGSAHEANEVALAAVKELRGQVRLAVRMLGESEELRAWHVYAVRRLGSPLWLIVHDGSLVGMLRGPRTSDELVDALRTVRRRFGLPG